MHPLIIAAIKQAEAILAEVAVIENPRRAELEPELLKLTKKQLVERILDNEAPNKSNGPKIADMVYTILNDPACVWLDFGIIAALIRKAYPNAKTSESSVAWYASKAIEKERDVRPRKRSKDMAALLLEDL